MSDDVDKLLAFISANRAYPAPMQFNVHQLGYAGFYFSLGGEDAVLRQIFKARIMQRKPGVFVDIGCNHPGFISNTYLFYCLGWRGVCIDADSDRAKDWATFRPEDIFVNTAIGEQAGQAFLVKHKTNEGAHRVQSDETLRGDVYHPPRPVQVRRLDDVLNQHLGDKRIDLMSLDIEGGEIGALKSNDWNRWRPGTIIMECNNFDFDAPRALETIDFLWRRGYRLHAKVGENVIMRLDGA